MFKLLKYLKPYWVEVLVLLFSIAVQTWFTLQLPALMAKIVNFGIVTGDKDYIFTVGFEMLGYAVLISISAISASFFSSRIGTAFSRDLRQDFFTKILSFSISEIDKFSTASLITRTTNDISQVQQTIVMMLSMMLRAPMMSIVALFQAFATAPNMTWIIALTVGIMLVLTTVILTSVVKKFKLFQKLLDKITLLTRENLTGLRVIRAFNNQKLEKRKFAATNSELTSTIISINKIMSLVSPLLGFLFNGVALLCIWIGISLMETDISYLGNMMAFRQYAIHVATSFLVLTFFFMMLPRANVSAARINEVLKTKSKIRWKKVTSGEQSQTPSLEFKKVSFRYENAEEDVLKNISFRAEAGETVAVIGSTGSGKSTLINLIPRFYEATSGEILVNNLNIKQYSEADLMKNIGLIPQKGLLFSGTIGSNIAFAIPGAKENELESAAKISQSSNFINKLPEKFNAHVAESGNNFSGGQKQRLSIARAIAKHPKIYLFDDSFSALDMKTDKLLRAALKPITKNSVVLIVAQRVDTIKDADKIIVLEKGKVAGIGTHQSLLVSCDVYREIVKSQLSDEEYSKELSYAA